MKKQFLIITILSIIGWSNSITAQTPNWLWAKSAGGTGDDYGNSISVDANGNVFMTGFFVSSTITFGTTTLTNSGYGDVFIVKYDAGGNVLWAKSAGGTGSDYGTSVSTDAGGNVFMTGYFVSSITFGTTTLTSAGGSDIFIVKYDSTGNVLWAKSAGGTNSDNGINVSSDIGGNVFISGCFFSPTITFGATTLTNPNSPGFSDIFIVKYDASGNVLWAKNAGGTDSDYGTSVSTDANGNVFIEGTFSSPTITFGSTTLTNSGSEDIFIAKYNASGNVLWAKSAGGTLDDRGNSVSTDAGGNVFMTGYFISSAIAFGTTTLNNSGYSDIFIVKYDASGNVLWAKKEGGTDTDCGYGVSTDAGGNVFIAGYFRNSTITFGTIILTNASVAGKSDFFIVKYDASGNVLWAKSAGGATNDFGAIVSTDASGNVFMTGDFGSPSITFGTTTLTNASASSYDLFIAKLDGTGVGIEELSEPFAISIAPNPFTSQTTLTFNTQQHNTTIKLSNILGKEIKTITFSGKQLTIDKGSNTEGIYFIQITDEKKNTVNRKIVME